MTYRITRIDNIQAVFSRKLLPKQHASNFKYTSLDLSPIPDLITWDFSCLVSTKDLEKAFPQKRHLNGFSPVWFRMWSLRTSLLSKVFVQYEHLNSFSFMCVLMCLFKISILVNCFLQSSQANGFTKPSLSSKLIRCLFVVKLFVL